MIPDMREENELKFYFATSNDIFVATHFVRPLMYLIQMCSFDARWAPVDIEPQKELVSQPSIIDEDDEDNFSINNATTTSLINDDQDPSPRSISNKRFFSEEDETRYNDSNSAPDPELDAPIEHIPQMQHVDSTESVGSGTKSGHGPTSNPKTSMTKIIVLRHHTFSSFHSNSIKKKSKSKKITKIAHESEAEPTLPNKVGCANKLYNIHKFKDVKHRIGKRLIMQLPEI